MPHTVIKPARHRFWLRLLLAGPVVFIGSFLVMAGAALWLPKGEAEVSHIVMPVLVMPAIWAALFFYAYLDNRLWRAYAVITTILGIHGLMIWHHLQGAG